MECLVCAVNPPQFDESFLCGPCFNSLRRDIATLVGAHTWLHLAMLNPAPVWRTGTIGRAPAGTRPPFDLRLFDARIEIEARLTGWARLTAEEHLPALAPPRDGQMATIGKWLLRQLPWVSDQPWVDAMAAELRESARTAYGLVPWDRIRRDLPLPCPHCHLLALAFYSGSDTIICRNRDCGKAVTWADYDKAVRAEAERQKLIHRHEKASAA